MSPHVGDQMWTQSQGQSQTCICIELIPEGVYRQASSPGDVIP